MAAVVPHSLGFAGSVLRPVPGSMLGIVGVQGLCLGRAAVTSLGYCWCVKVHVCLPCVDKGYCGWEFQKQEKPQNWWPWIKHLNCQNAHHLTQKLLC